MGSTIFYTATTLDGFIADEHDSLDWLFEVPAGDDTEGHEARFARFIGGVGAMAMGSTTYEWIVGYEHLLEHPEKWRRVLRRHPELGVLPPAAAGDRGRRPAVRAG